MAIPIQQAHHYKSYAVWEELLLHTDVDRTKGTVQWHGLRLLQINMSWIKAVKWVRRFKLAKNGFRSIPDDIGRYLKQVNSTYMYLYICVCVCVCTYTCMCTCTCTYTYTCTCICTFNPSNKLIL